MPKFIHFPVVDMRELPSEASKVVSQALFGEEIEVKGEEKGWYLIQTPDEYRGWIQSGFTTASSYPKDLEITRLKAHIFARADTEYGPLMTLPYGSPLKVLGEWDARWIRVQLPCGREAFVQKGDVEAEAFDLLSFSKKFLGLPYTWGGRSSLGFDCSGFVQMVYGRMGIRLARDAREQILDPRAKFVRIEELVPGDLIFWGKSSIEIKHVGMLLYCAREGFLNLDASETKQNRSEAVRPTKEISEGNISEEEDRFGEVAARQNFKKPTARSIEGSTFIHATVQENKPYLRLSLLSDEAWSGQEGSIYPYRTARRWL